MSSPAGDADHHGYEPDLEPLLDSGWLLKREGPWLHVIPESAGAKPLAAQGFKIHLSSDPSCARRLLRTVAPILIARGVQFKTVGDRARHYRMNAKHQPRGSSGKFMTVYPATDTEFRSLLEILDAATTGRGFIGPRILSDRRYGDSPVLYYRWGGFRPLWRVEIDGRRTWLVTSPDGAHEPDERLPYFRLPTWVDDPFGGTAEIENDPGFLLGDRFSVEGALRFSNSGGVYAGTDMQTGHEVVLKEARPYTNPWTVAGHTWDAVDLLRREHAMLVALEDLGIAPRPVALFAEGDHLFLAEERVPGVTMETFAAMDENIVAPYLLVPGRLQRWIPRFWTLADRLLTMIQAIHERGVVLGDLSPRNVLIDPSNLQMWLIDLESAVSLGDDPRFARYAAEWGTPGFKHPDRTNRACLLPEDDLYAVGMVLMAQLLPVTPLFHLEAGALDGFLERFEALGVPTDFAALVRALVAGSGERARAVLDSWEIPSRGELVNAGSTT